jgi:AraC-like DNA-binding protein
MLIHRFLPHQSLALFIKEYLILECDDSFVSKTLPDTSVVMSFRYGGKVSLIEASGESSISVSAIAGLRKSVRHFKYDNATANLLVIFREGGFYALTGIPTHEAFGLSISSENVFAPGEVEMILEQLALAKDHYSRVHFVERLLQQKFQSARMDEVVTEAIKLIKSANGIVRVDELAKTLCISQDPLEKRFRRSVGTSPKQYATIVRLRNLISGYHNHSTLTEAALHAGYFDQSHFIKDFRSFTGQSPRDFFKSSDFW